MITDMPPQQPYSPPPAQPTPPQPNQGQYDFIMSPQQPKRPSLMPGGSFRLVFIVLGIVSIIVVLLVIMSSVFGGSKIDKAPFVKAAQQQQEILRVSDLQYQALTRQDAQNFVINTQLSMTTDQQTFTSVLSRNHIKVSSKQLQQGADGTIDKRLDNAVSSSTINKVLPEELRTLLQKYQVSLKQAYNTTPDKPSRQAIQRLYDNANLLITQSKQ